MVAASARRAAVAGLRHPVSTQEALRAEEPAVAALDAVLEAWAEALRGGRLPDEPLTVKQLLGQNCNTLERQLRTATLTRDTEIFLSEVKVGMFLKLHKERIRKGLRLRSKVNLRSGPQRWWLEGSREFQEASKVLPPTAKRNEPLIQF